ncbi:bifunctional diguanylate cyclase/phosphodiesterase [Alteromonas sp. 5E99-2]|uniref:putative bifunctional diguanylate cyclase/phosphodiesterase n=1 Tax=Alteromonas sp. 5E99-2 TaxID=2817683 RepID=UPI001A986BD3|nr:bifunctional diguanylate cyclase/phosphodiesterase [Alteromonas sp. 5E99-2]MBO1254970.1 bifunctional diguanylate cyclase/phosphodiesterase [Alteromonas sp. 5E99-2]
MKSVGALFEILGLVDCAILKHEKENEFTVIHAPLGWFYWLFPNANVNHAINIDDNHSFISNFLLDANEFWLEPDSNQISSGIWSESIMAPSGGEKLLCLECVAAYANGEKLLVIKNAQTAHENKQETLQVARETLLSHDKILAQHDYLSQKLQGVIKQNSTVLELHLPIEQAIQNTEIGVIITDSEKTPLFSNLAAFSSFALDPVRTDTTPLAIVQQLIETQFPESSPVFLNDKSWNGELYWHCPPDFDKWLQVTIKPVKNHMGSTSHWIIAISDTTRLKHLLQKNENLMLKDALTGLPNRQYMWKFLEKKCLSNSPFNLLFIDILRFKRINELYGHTNGDKILKDIATKLLSIESNTCHVARIGSARFAVISLLNEYTDTSEQRVAARILYEDINEMMSEPFLTQKRTSYTIDSNMSVALYPEDTTDAESLVKAADMALTELQDNQDSNFQFYSIEMSKANEKRLQLEVKLKNAVDKDDFRIYLQPIIDTETERVVKAEALIRWTTPEGEMISPDVFIPIAEQTGLIIPLGNWVIRQVCDLLTYLREKKINIKLSINLSPKQVSDRYLFDFIKETAIQSGIDAQRLELELTEGVLLNNYDKAVSLLTSLRNMGVSISIDDFGTGYSSLSYLKNLPIDYLKIDRSFISELESNDDDRAIVLAILAMAKQLNISVIAEGVETKEQREFLNCHDCEEIQGFYYSKPIPVDEFVHFFRQQNG